MRVVVSGASGLIGTALRGSLVAAGHDVVRLVRRPARTPDEVEWDPATGRLDPSALDDADVVVNLSGANVGDKRWTDEFKRLVLDSRLGPTRTLAAAVARQGGRVALVNASATGLYGIDRGDEALTEEAAHGSDFLATVVESWEAATEPAAAAGARVALPRCGLVQSRHGGAFARMLPMARLGVAARLGNGRQWFPAVSLRDVVRAYQLLVETDARGPYNVVGQPMRNTDFTQALGSELRCPVKVFAPRLALQVVLGEFAGNVLGSQRVEARRLHEAGFTFEDRDATSIVRSALDD